MVNVGKYTIHVSYGIYFLILIPIFWGEMNQFDEYVYSKVWFDHQLVNFHRSQVKLSWTSDFARLFSWLHGCDLFAGRWNARIRWVVYQFVKLVKGFSFQLLMKQKQCDDMFEKMMIHSLKQELMWPNSLHFAKKLYLKCRKHRQTQPWYAFVHFVPRMTW